MAPTEYAVRHRELRDWMASFEVIMNQLTGGRYASLDIYLNNMNIIVDIYRDVGMNLKDPGFQSYIKKHDQDLFITVLSLGRSMILMKNLLLNMKRLLGVGDSGTEK